MSIAITGGTGFVGKATLDVAARKALPVKALTRSIQSERTRLEWIKGDLHTPDALERLAQGCETVIHIAGLTNTPDPSRFHKANVVGTQNLIAACKNAGVKRMVFVSSLSAREPNLSKYGASKAEAEQVVRQSGLDWVIVRPPAVYGPNDSDMFELFRAAKFGIVPMPPKGRTSIIHVEDLARLLIALASAFEGERAALVRGQTYEPWDDNADGYDHSDFAKMIGEAVGNSNVWAPNLPKGLLEIAAQVDRTVRGGKAKLTLDRVGYMTHPDWVCDIRKAPPLSLWQAHWSGEAGLKMTADWYKEQGWL